MHEANTAPMDILVDNSVICFIHIYTHLYTHIIKENMRVPKHCNPIKLFSSQSVAFS